jgi:predicted amidohydrolase YtcJ
MGDGVIDLGGAYLLPSFIDAHCHILPTGLDLSKLHLGIASTKQEVLQMLADWHRAQPDGWLLAVHYNQTKFVDGEHLTLQELDQISSSRPILLTHVNGHASVANSAAFAAAKIDNSTPDPSGGAYRRDADGKLDGVCLEHAHEFIQRAKPMPTIEQMAEAIVLAGQKMSEFGISCASDMMTGCFDLERELQAYTLATRMGCPIHIRLYLQWRDVFGKRAVPQDRLKDLIDAANAETSLRVQGIKIFSDGGISSATAAIYGRFLSTDPQKALKLVNGIETDGQLIYNPEKLNLMFLRAHESGMQVSVHAIGDYATDLVLDAMALTDEPSRHRIEHAMILSDSQIERMRGVGCYCTFQPEFLMALGPAYRRQLGEARASKLIRSRSVLDAGIPLSFNSDRPIVAGNPWDGILTASNRPTDFDSAENCTRAEAILAYTAAAAEVNGDKGEMGTLESGSLAHFQLYEDNPLLAEKPISKLIER